MVTEGGLVLTFDKANKIGNHHSIIINELIPIKI